jgi:hypothetical protein
MKKAARLIHKLYLQLAGGSEEGMTLELIEGNEFGEIAEGGLYPAARIVGDNSEIQWLEIYPEGEIVRIPITEIEQALLAAKEAVHGANFYDQQNSKTKDK